MTGVVTSKLEQRVGTIEFSSPKANSLTSAMLLDFINAVRTLAANPECSVVVVKSRGETFCAGASFDEMKLLASESDATRFFSLFGLATLELRRAPQPVVVLVQGKAVGGGVGLAAAADFCVGSQNAQFRLSEFSVGIAPFAISPVLEWKIGAARLLELSLMGEFRDAEWARSTGLLSELVESDLAGAEQRLVTKLLSYPRTVVSQFKQLLSGDLALLEREISLRAQMSAQALLAART